MNHIQFEINQTPCELIRKESGFLLIVSGEPRITLNSFEIWLWLNQKLDIGEDVLLLGSPLDNSTLITVMDFVGVDNSRFI
jgi:hypothetical protein